MLLRYLMLRGQRSKADCHEVDCNRVRWCTNGRVPIMKPLFWHGLLVQNFVYSLDLRFRIVFTAMDSVLRCNPIISRWINTFIQHGEFEFRGHEESLASYEYSAFPISSCYRFTKDTNFLMDLELDFSGEVCIGQEL